MSTLLKGGSASLGARKKGAALLVVGALVGVLLAYLIAIGLWPFVLILVLAYPGFVLLHRRPLIVIPI